MKPLIVIPTYNEKENISALVRAIKELKISSLDILVVDDNSPDGTAAVVPKLQGVHVEKRKAKLGLGSAYQHGFRWGLERGYDLFFQMDADFSHDPQDVHRMIYKIQRGADVVIGSRRVKGGKVIGWNMWRHFSSWGANSFSRLLLQLKTKDVTAGYRAFTKKSLSSIEWQNVKSNGYAFQEEMVYLCERAGLTIKEIPVYFVDRKLGKSKLGLNEIINFFKTIFRLRFSK